MIDQYVLASNDDGDLAIRTVQATESSSVTDTTSVITATDDGKLAVRVVGAGGGGSDQHNLGWYATQAALEEAHPTAEAGDWAIVGATDTVWLWDTDNEEWVDSDQKGQVTSVNGQTGDVVLDLLPSQTGQSGKFLTTDGTDASWSDKPLVNTATDTTSLAIGGTIGASNSRSVVIGQNANTTANWATVIGSMATSLAADTVSIGYGTIQSGGRYSIGIGEFGSGSAGGINAQNSIAIVPRIAAVTQLTAHDTIVLGAVYSFSGLKNNTFYVGLGTANGQTYELLSSDGTIPTARFTTDPVADGTYYPTLTISSGTPTRSWSTISALQNTATGINGLSILGTSSGNYSIVIGSGATDGGAGGGVAIGKNAQAKSTYTVAIGENARANDNGAIGIGGYAQVGAEGAIQIGGGINNETGTVKFMVKASGGFTNYKLMDSDGTIPTARLTKVNSTITLTAADWSGGSQTVTVSGVTSTSVVLVAPDPSDTADYVAAGILCTSQTTDSLTFTATTTPTNDIDVNIVCL